MSKSLRSYDELLAYQVQLKELLAAQRELIRSDITDLKTEVRPLTNVAHVVSQFFTRSKDHSALVNGASSIIGMALRNFVLPKAGWATRMIVPFLAKNFSSHLMAHKKDGLLDKLAAIIKPKNKI